MTQNLDAQKLGAVLSQQYKPTRIVDSHQHLWAISERPYEWLSPDLEVLYRDYRMSDIQQSLDAAGISATVLVQASDSYADTFAMVSEANANPQIVAVVGWVAMDRPAEARIALDAYRELGVVRGIRALTHGYEQLDWIGRSDVAETLDMISEEQLTLDYVATGPEHREAIQEVSGSHPELKIVLDHFTKPDIAGGEWEPWAESMRKLSELPNVYSKVSGLNTLSKPDWQADDWRPYLKFMVEQFGSERLMIGSDWPFARLNGEFEEVWNGLVEILGEYSTKQQDDIFFRTAESFYRLR